MMILLSFCRNLFVTLFLAFAGLLLLLQIPSINTRVAQGIINLVTPTDMHIRIKGIQGSFPFDITIDKVKIKDDRSAWMEISGASIDWQGVDILYGNIHFAKIEAKQVIVWRAPDSKPSKEPPSALRLPRLNIDKIRVDKLQVPVLFSGDILVAGQIISPKQGELKATVDLGLGDDSSKTINVTYAQDEIEYTLKCAVNRPIHDFARLSPSTFKLIKSGQTLVDLDLRGDTHFRSAQGHILAQIMDFQTTDATLQENLGQNPKFKLAVNADDSGTIHKAHGDLFLGLDRHLSCQITPTDTNVYALDMDLKTQGQTGHLSGFIDKSDNGIQLNKLRFSGFSSKLQGSLTYQDTLSGKISGTIDNLEPLSTLIKYPLSGRVDLEATYSDQELFLAMTGSAIAESNDKNLIDQFSVDAHIISGDGNVKAHLVRQETELDLDVGISNEWQTFKAKNFSLMQSKTPLIFLNKPLEISYVDQKLSIGSGLINLLDGQIVIKNLELSDIPKGEIILDKVTAKILNPLIKDVNWQGALLGRLKFNENKKISYYSGNLKLVDFGIENDFRKRQKLINISSNFSHTGEALTATIAYSDSVNSIINGKLQIDTTHYIPQALDKIKSSLVGTLDLSVLNTLIWWGDRFKGVLTIDLTSNGHLNEPQTKGRLLLENAYYENSAIGLVLKEINGSATYAAQKLVLANFRGEDYDKGTFDMSGSAVFNESYSPTLALTLNFHKLMLVNTDQAIISISGKVNGLTLRPHYHQLKGNIQVDSALINLSQVTSPPKTIKTFHTKEDLLKTEPNSHEDLRTTVDINVEIPKKLLVQGYGLRSEWKGKLVATGAINAPDIAGKINSISGHIDISSKHLVLAPSSVSFSTINGNIMPILDIRATKQVREYDASIGLTGSSNDPKIEFYSLPALSKQDVVALILFDKPMAEVSAAQSLQLATTMAALKAGNFSGGTLNSLSHLLGVDDISIQKDENPTTADEDKQSYSLAAGKQLSKNVYVGIEQGLQQDVGTKMKMKIDVTKHTKVDLETGTENNAAGYGFEFKY